MSTKSPCVYILTNKNNTVLYVGVTSNILRRIIEHKGHKYDGFSKQYNVYKLIYLEFFESMVEAINKEKLIKGGSRQRKISLINKQNPSWHDLSSSLV